MNIRALFFGGLIAIVFLLSALPAPAQAAVCSITTDTLVNQVYVTDNSCTSIEINGNVSTTWIGTVDLGGGTVTVKTGNTMTMGTNSEMVLGVNDDFEVEANATTTHTASDPNGLKITARNVTITGALDVDAKGCQGGSAAPAQDGYGPDSGAGVCTLSATGAGSSDRGGAGHAGRGGYGWGDYTYGTTYGSTGAPVLLGSGGGGGANGGETGGHGGGRVQVNALNVLTIDGSIRAGGGDGGAGSYGGGGGSGGSVYLRAGSLDGAGSISANGGDGTQYGGGGGGGRIAVYYTALGGFNPENISAEGGIRGSAVADSSVGPKAGSVGAAFTLDRYTDDGSGSLFIGGGLELSDTFDTSRDDISFQDGAHLRCAASDTITLSSASSLYLDNVVWDCENAVSRLNIWSGSSLYLTRTTSTFSGAITYLDIAASSTLVTTSTLWAASGVDYARFSASTWTSSVSSTFILSKAGASSTWDIANDLTLNSVQYVGAANAGSTYANGGVLSILNAIDVSLVNSDILSSVSSTSITGLTIDADSSIDASGRGCRGGIAGGANAFGPNTSTGICTLSTSGYGRGFRSGGAHGGSGGSGPAGIGGLGQTATYGDMESPDMFGSGGSAGGNAGEHGRNGGGKIYLRVLGPVAIQGAIRADSGPLLPSNVSQYGVGGGSGGSIFLRGQLISGSGVISANGGGGPHTSVDDISGGGGGGRVAVLYSGFSGFDPDVQITYAGGVAGPPHWWFGQGESGGSGTLYTLQVNQAPNIPASLGQMSLVNGSTTGTTNPIFAFTLSDDDVADTVQYRIQIDDSSDFSSPVVDYTSALAAQGAATFQVGQAAGSGTYTVGSVSQTLADGSYYWRVKAIDGAAAESSYTTANSGSIAFIVDSAVRTVEFESLSLSGGESVTATSVRIVLDTTHFEDVSVDYAVYAPSSTAQGGGVDYTLASGTATITAGQTSTTIALVIVNDQIAEPDEVIAIALSSPVFATIGTNATTTYTILDNDTAGVSLSKTTMALAEGGAADTYTLVLTSQPTSTVNIVLTVPTDLQTDATTFTFTSGNWSIPQMVTVTATQDMLQEGTHVASITHATNIPSGYAYGYSGMSGITDLDVTIADDETASIAVSATTLSVTEGQNNSFTIVLGTAPLTPVDILVSAGSGLTATPSTVTFTSSNYSTPASVLVTATNDTIYSGNRASTLTLTVSTTATGYTSQTLSSFTVTIVDDEQAGGGAAGGGFGGGNVSPIALLPFAPQPVAPPSANVPPPPPVIVVVPDLPPPPPPAPAAPAPSPSIPQVVSILNPSDVLSLVRATQNGRDYEREGKVFTQVTQDLREMSVSATDGDKLSLANFITYGISERTYALGEGERRALVRDALQTMRTAKISPADLERLTRGIIPSYRNLEAERAQVRRAQATFRSIYGGRDPNFKDPSENLAWNTLMYRIRFPRDLAAEREGIREFRRLFGRTPTDPFQWATVRVLGYVR